MPSPAAAHVAAAQALLARGDAVGALGELDAAFTADPDDEAALLTRIEALLALGRGDHAPAVLAELDPPKRVASRPIRDERRLGAVKARIALGAGAGTDLGALANAAAKTPVDCSAKLAYANALVAKGDYERALAELLNIVKADRQFDNDAGRRTMLTIFEALGGDSGPVRPYRPGT